MMPQYNVNRYPDLKPQPAQYPPQFNSAMQHYEQPKEPLQGDQRGPLPPPYSRGKQPAYNEIQGYQPLEETMLARKSGTEMKKQTVGTPVNPEYYKSKDYSKDMNKNGWQERENDEMSSVAMQA